MRIKEEVIKYANEIGVEFIGFSDTIFSKEFIQKLSEKRVNGHLSGFEEEDENKRIDVKSFLDDAETIISIAVPYKTCDLDKERPYISKSSLGIDYHKVVFEKLKDISSFIENKYSGKCLFSCDTGMFSDREIAKKCGIGFYGKNSNIINEKYGSFIFLGEIITNIYIERDIEIQNKCGKCELCIKGCPAGAIQSPFYIDAKKCISYITQKKEDLTDYEMDIIGTRIYGCDSCQDICPYNKRASFSELDEFVPKKWNKDVDVEAFLNMSNKDFKETFKDTSSGWRGKKILIRNLVVAMGNSNSKEYICILKKYIDNEYLKKYILRSIKKLEGM